MPTPGNGRRRAAYSGRQHSSDERTRRSGPLVADVSRGRSQPLDRPQSYAGRQLERDLRAALVAASNRGQLAAELLGSLERLVLWGVVLVERECEYMVDDE